MTREATPSKKNNLRPFRWWSQNDDTGPTKASRLAHTTSSTISRLTRIVNHSKNEPHNACQMQQQGRDAQGWSGTSEEDRRDNHGRSQSLKTKNADQRCNIATQQWSKTYFRLGVTISHSRIKAPATRRPYCSAIHASHCQTGKYLHRKFSRVHS